MNADKNSYPYKYIGDAIVKNLPEKYSGHGWQTDMALELKVTRQEVNAWVRGKRKPGMDNLRKIAALLGVPLAKFMGNSVQHDTSTLEGGEAGIPIRIEAIRCFRLAESLTHLGRHLLGDKDAMVTVADLDALTTHLQDISKLAETIETPDIPQDRDA